MICGAAPRRRGSKTGFPWHCGAYSRRVRLTRPSDGESLRSHQPRSPASGFGEHRNRHAKRKNSRFPERCAPHGQPGVPGQLAGAGADAGFWGPQFPEGDFCGEQIGSLAERNVSGLRVIHGMAAGGNNPRREITDAQEQAAAPASPQHRLSSPGFGPQELLAQSSPQRKDLQCHSSPGRVHAVDTAFP